MTLNEALIWARADNVDPEIACSLLHEARERTERDTRQSIGVGSKYTQRMDGFPNSRSFSLLIWPVQSVVLKYVDQDGVEQTVDAADYQVDSYERPAVISLAKNASWPNVDDVPNCVIVEMDAGYASVAEIPATLKNAVKIAFDNVYSQRGDEVLCGCSAYQYIVEQERIPSYP